MAQAAEILGISTRHLRNLAHRGLVRIVQLGRRTLVPATEVDRIVAGEGAAP